MKTLLLYIPILLLAAAPVIKSEPQAVPKEPRGEMPLLFVADFEDGKTDRWEPTDSKAWSIVEDHGSRVYALTADCDFKPPFRSPVNFSLVKDLDVTDFIFQAKIRSTTQDYNHRDLCLIFGYNDPAHYYYVHLALKADEHANSIFLVNGAPRVSIAKTRTDGTVWTEDFHLVRVVRKTAAGTIEIYFDNLEKPVMTALDENFKHGRLGVGSFDDTGNFDDVKVWGIKAPPK